VSEGDKEDVDLAVKAARQAFDNGPWPRLPGCVSRFISSSSSYIFSLLNCVLNISIRFYLFIYLL
jgi:hypothetical protein